MVVAGEPRVADAYVRAAFESAAIGIVVVGADGILLCANPLVASVTGYRPDELVGRSFVAFTHPDDVAEGTAIFADVVAGRQQGHQVERRYLRKDGSTIWARVTMSMPPGMAPPIVVAMIEDITETRRVSHALGERVKELTALHRVSRLMLDADRPRGEALQEIAALLPPAMQFPNITTACVRYRERTFATVGHAPTPWTLVAPFHTSDGAQGEIVVAYHEDRAIPGSGPFLPEESALLASLGAIIGSALDRDLAIDDLRETNEHLNLALGAAGMAVWEWNLDSGQVRWSEQLAEMTGVDAPSVFTMGDRSHVVHPDDADRLMTLLRSVAERRERHPTSGEFRLRRPDGSWRQMLVVARGVSGPTKRVIAALVDVSLRHALEEGLRQAQKVEALGQVAAGVAHDFNNLLAVIIGGVDFIRDEMPDDHPWREIVDDVHGAAGNAVGLTRQLLVFSRKGQYQPAAIELSSLLAQLQSLLVRLAGRGVTVRCEIGHRVGKVWADPTQLEQVIINLVVNARDAMGERGTVTVTTAVEESFAVLSVADTGPGISAEVQARIFEPFFTTKEAGKGTGLGLALVAGVARQWGGRVELVSAPGQGATFRVLFPLLAP